MAADKVFEGCERPATDELTVFGRLGRWRWLLLSGLLAHGLLAPWTLRAQAPVESAKRITQYVLDVWQLDDGLPSNHIEDILQTGDGFLWLATQGGLVRFDGVRFRVFNKENTPAFESDDFGRLAEGPDGSLWAGSRGTGLYRLRAGRWSVHRAASPAGNDVRALLFDREGTLWVGTLAGLYRLRQGELSPVDTPEPLAGAYVRTLHEDGSGNLWIGTLGHGLLRRRAGEIGRWPSDQELASQRITAVHSDRQGILWIGTAAGLHRVADDRVTLYTEADGLATADVRRLFEDRSGSLWIATNRGLSRLSGDRFETFGEVDGLTDTRLRSLFEDRERNLWTGSYGGGLSRLRDGPITAFTAREGLSGNRIRSIFGDPEGNLWIGMLGGGGIDRLANDATVTSFAPAEAFPSTVAWSILEDRSGVLWVGTNHGLLRYSAGKLRRYTTEHGLSGDRIRVVYEDPEEPGTLWLGTIGDGVNRFRDGAITAYGVAEGLSHGNVRWIQRDRGGDLWIGTESGLNRFENGGFAVFTTGDGLSSNAMRSVYQAADDTLWLGTRGGGLMRYRDGDFTAYGTREGLPYDDVWWILEDDRGHLWLSSDEGITRVRKLDLDAYDQGRLASIPARVYGLADGMKVVECNGAGYPSGWKMADGTLWFPTMGGVVRVDPDWGQHRAPPPVYVDSFVADQTPVDPGTMAVLPPGHGDLELHYTALDLSHPERVRFRYRLAGYDPDWIDAGTRRVAFYTNIPPGDYEFRVLAGTDDVGWDGADEDGRDGVGAAVAFTLAPHFYQTWWFYTLSGLLLATAIGGGFWFGTRAIRLRNRRLLEEIDRRKKAQAEREKFVAELEAKNAELERFTYTVSHDLTSPLVTIKGFLGLLRQDVAAVGEDPGAAERVEHDLQRIGAAADKMRRLLEELLELSRVGRLVNPREHVSFSELAREAAELVAGPLESRGVEIDIAPDMPAVFVDRTRLVEVFQNLFENASRFMGDQASPRIEVAERPADRHQVCCCVRDNGLGIDPRYQEKIFGLFERLDPQASDGTGIGLALVKRIVELHGGRIWVESEGRGRGSTFCITLPSGRPKKGKPAA